MTKVFVFDTLAEAKKFRAVPAKQNKLVNAGINDECTARLRVYKNSADFYKQHKFSDEELTREEAEVVFSRAGKRPRLDFDVETLCSRTNRLLCF